VKRNMKLGAKDLDDLSAAIKDFKAGAIDRHLDTHIDKCVAELKVKAQKRRLFWRIREYGLFWRFK